MPRILMILFLSALFITGCREEDESLKADDIISSKQTGTNAAEDNDEIIPDLSGSVAEEHVDSQPVVINGTSFNPPPRPASQLNKRFGNRQKLYAPMINEISKRYGVEPYLTHAIISQESVYKPSIGSSVGAIGLMQLMPYAGKRFGCVNRTNPRCNVNAGVKYLKFLARYFEGKGGNLQTIASGYNAGEGATMSYLKGTRMSGKNPRGRKTPNGVPVASFALSNKQKARCSGVNWFPSKHCEGQTYHYARNVAGYYLFYKQNPHIIGLGSASKQRRPTSRATARGRY